MSPMEASTHWDGGIVIRWWNCHQLIRGIPLQEPLSWEVCVCVRFVCWEEVVKSDVLGRKYQVERRAKGAELKGYTNFPRNHSSRISTQQRRLLKFQSLANPALGKQM